MSEPITTIYNISDELVARFKFGVGWTNQNRVRLGSYDDEFIYDNESSMIAKVNHNHVLNIIGEEIGHVKEGEIFIAGKKTGKYIGSAAAGAAAVALVFNNEAVYGS